MRELRRRQVTGPSELPGIDYLSQNLFDRFRDDDLTDLQAPSRRTIFAPKSEHFVLIADHGGAINSRETGNRVYGASKRIRPMTVRISGITVVDQLGQRGKRRHN